MSRRPPCGRWCPFVLTCRECDWQSLWLCQICTGPAHEGEVICGECAGQGSYNAVVSRDGRGIMTGYATSEQSDPPGAFLAVGSTRGSDHNPTAKEST